LPIEGSNVGISDDARKFEVHEKTVGPGDCARM
jgi:hypothetical protein